MQRTKYLAMLVSTLGIVIVVLGAVFIGLAVQKNSYITNALRAQNITLGLTPDQVAKGELVDNAQTAQVAAETLSKHLTSIAPTYGALMAANTNTGGKYDPTNAKDLTYTQGLNMENSMNLAVLSFGVVQETTVTGITLIIIGILAGITGLTLLRLTRKQVETEKAPAIAARAVAYETD